MHSLKALSCFSALMALSASLTFGQSTKPNRQQELYDEHNGVKTKTKTFTPETTDSQRNKSQRSRDEDEKRAAEKMAEATDISSDGNISNVRIGIRGGVTYPVYTQKSAFVKPNIGFVGGLTFNFGHQTLSFQPEINYTRYAFKIDDGFGFVSSQARDVLEVPLFLKIASGTYAGNRFFLNVGPYASYVASISSEGKKGDLSQAKGRFGFGAAAGVGTALKAGPGHVTIEVRGLYPLGDFDNGFSTNANIIYGQAAVGYIFPFGGR